MKKSMMRVSEDFLVLLRVLKDEYGAASYEGVLEDLVTSRLKETRACTAEGYLAVGTVVADRSGAPLVIKEVVNGMVVFNDNSRVVNGGGFCMELSVLADTVGEYDGGRRNG